MTRLAIIRPADPIEDRRFVEQLLNANVPQTDIDRGFIDSADSPMEWLFPGSVARMTSLAAGGVTPGALDYRDDLTPMSSSSTGYADGVLATAITAIASLQAALASPTTGDIGASIRTLHRAIEAVDAHVGTTDVLGDSSRTAFDNYRATVRTFLSTLPAVTPEFSDSNTWSLTNEWRDTLATASEHAGVGRLAAFFYDSGTEVCSWHLSLPFLGTYDFGCESLGRLVLTR